MDIFWKFLLILYSRRPLRMLLANLEEIEIIGKKILPYSPTVKRA